MGKKTDLFYIYKFNSRFLIDNALGRDMKYDIETARRDLNLVSLADNQVFFFLRKIKGTPFETLLQYYIISQSDNTDNNYTY